MKGILGLVATLNSTGLLSVDGDNDNDNDIMDDDNDSQTQPCLWFAHDAHPESPSQGDAEDPGQISFRSSVDCKT